MAGRRMRSGWCETGFCGRCVYLLQTANPRRREIRCDCACHKTNEFEQRKRIDKAWKLSATLQQHGATPQAAAALPLKARLDTALIAGVNPPSETTWKLTVEYLTNRLKATGHNVRCFQLGTGHYYFARCSCGWESDGTGSMQAAHQIGDQHVEGETNDARDCG